MLDERGPNITLTFCVYSDSKRQSARMSKITNWRLNPVWHRMLYSCTHMAIVGVKEIKRVFKAPPK